MQQMRVQPRQVEKGGPTFRTRDGFPNAVERREYLGQIAVLGPGQVFAPIQLLGPSHPLGRRWL